MKSIKKLFVSSLGFLLNIFVPKFGAYAALINSRDVPVYGIQLPPQEPSMWEKIVAILFTPIFLIIFTILIVIAGTIAIIRKRKNAIKKDI